MEFLHESIALGVDLIIIGICAREYVHYKRTAQVLKVRILDMQGWVIFNGLLCRRHRNTTSMGI